MTPAKVCFTPDAAELSRVQAALSKLRPGLSRRFAIALGVLFVIEGVMNLTSRHIISHWLGYVQILFGLCYAPLVWSAQKTAVLQATASTEIDLTVDDAGITLVHPAMHIPWKRIAAIRNVGEAFVVVRTHGKAIPILKRTLPDNGSELWASLDARLTATRYLVRGTDSRLTIVNSAARS